MRKGFPLAGRTCPMSVVASQWVPVPVEGCWVRPQVVQGSASVLQKTASEVFVLMSIVRQSSIAGIPRTRRGEGRCSPYIVCSSGRSFLNRFRVRVGRCLDVPSDVVTGPGRNGVPLGDAANEALRLRPIVFAEDGVNMVVKITE